MGRLIAQFPSINPQLSSHTSPYKTPHLFNSPIYNSPITLKKPSSSSDTPTSGMRSMPIGGSVQSQGSLQPNSNSYVPIQEDYMEEDLNQHDDNEWEYPNQVPFESNEHTFGSVDPHQSPS